MISNGFSHRIYFKFHIQLISGPSMYLIYLQFRVSLRVILFPISHTLVKSGPQYHVIFMQLIYITNKLFILFNLMYKKMVTLN
jgi:hypothetical protein